MEGEEEEEEGNTKSHGCLGALCKIDGGDDRPHTQSTKDSNLRPLSMPLPLSLCETFIGNNAPRQKSELSLFSTCFCLSMHQTHICRVANKERKENQTRGTLCSESLSHHSLSLYGGKKI